MSSFGAKVQKKSQRVNGFIHLRSSMGRANFLLNLNRVARYGRKPRMCLEWTRKLCVMGCDAYVRFVLLKVKFFQPYVGVTLSLALAVGQ